MAKAISTYFDQLINNVMSNAFRETFPMDVDFLSPYVDFFPLVVTMVFASKIFFKTNYNTFIYINILPAGLAFGAKESTLVNNIFTLSNLAVVTFVIVSGLFLVDTENWAIPADKVPEGFGTGGFAPYGFTGVIKGAAICFYGFIGFDVIATAGECTFF